MNNMTVFEWILTVSLSGIGVVLAGKCYQFIRHKYRSRISYRKRIITTELKELFEENRITFLNYGPNVEREIDYERSEEIVDLWLAKVKEVIIPNNSRIIDILKSNKDLMTTEELKIFEKFENHVQGFKSRHLHGTVHAPRFPLEIVDIFK